jgi:(1->4)-alpha-D-glucan 1-alpha-D-glucosylmutase
MTMHPIATYRLQLRPGFGFDEVAAVADYLTELGVSHAYLSPYLQAAEHSTHGYDVVDPSRVNRELGGKGAHARMVAQLRAQNLGQIVDVVPNHMAIDTPENRFWWDLLEHGPHSRYAEYFDIDWRPPESRLRDKVLRPILADHYGRVLESGAIRAERAGVTFRLRVHERQLLPLNPSSVGALLAQAAARCSRRELAFIADALGALPQPGAPDASEAIALRRERDLEVLAQMLERLLNEEPEAAAAVDAVLAATNASVDALDELIEHQHYRISYWRMGRHDLDYRRFFDIDALAALRAERADVFRDTHTLILGWVRAGEADGLRIDHPDGLRDPGAYFARLRARAPEAWIVAEKILQPDETLPADWPIEGTTGYDFLALVTGLFVDPRGEQPLTDTYAQFVGTEAESFAAIARSKKRLVLDELLASELERLAAVLVEVCERQPRFRDYSRTELRRALRELIACMPVYRTYVRPGERAGARDLAYLAEATERAQRSEPAIDHSLLGFIARILRGEIGGDSAAELCARFQQLSAAVMAKGVEDTAFFCYPRLLALNEVGCDPGRFGVGVEQFHAHCARIQRAYPTTLLASSTHDTKYSEDVRARIALLSEMPQAWAQAVRRWSELAAPHRAGRDVDRHFEYAFYQLLVGAFPIEIERLLAHLQKFTREAKVHSSWLEPNERYEQAVAEFARGVLRDADLMSEIGRFVDALHAPARVHALAQLVLKLTAPGVPDIYQGNEVWRHDLTDPDNRRAVDFRALRAKLARVRAMDAREVQQDADPDLLKLFVTQRLLALRRRIAHAFGREGRYQALEVHGARAAHVVAFSRGDQVVTLVPRLSLRVRGDWGDTRVALPEGRFEHWLEHGEVEHGSARVADLLAGFPVAVLVARGVVAPSGPP